MYVAEIFDIYFDDTFLLMWSELFNPTWEFCT